MTSTVLILGARGRFGLATARAFADAGWRVLGQIRPGGMAPTLVAARTALPPEGAERARGGPSRRSVAPMLVAARTALPPEGAERARGGPSQRSVAPTPVAQIEWLGIDLYDTAAISRAAQGATVVVHALNPAYTSKAWQTQVGPMADAAISVARALGATLMVPGNIYNFGASMPQVLREDTPQTASTVKGRVRVAMEQQLQNSGVRAIVIRAGDFFGSGKGTWFDTAMVKNIRKGAFTYPGPLDVSRAWAYLPDLARTFVAVAQRRAALQAFEVFHFAGSRITGQRWLDVLTPVARAQGWVKPDAALKVTDLPWAVIRVGAPFVPTWASLIEMRYLWSTPHALANDRLTALIGSEPFTPLAVAALAALSDLGLLEDAVPPKAPAAQDRAFAVN